ncbi:MAG: hypothetical protein ACJ8F7_18940 [Gemmataceae bacterium]
MAAAPAPTRVSPQDREKIYSPLHSLRGTIRRYVVLEALGTLVVFLSLWFWLGLGFDYFTFRLTGIDFVQVLPKWFRAFVLIVIVAAFAVLMVFKLKRLLAQFRPEALALLLERRFPRVLGDRLITAVELSSDLDDAERNGYSRAMILDTVRQVTAKVDSVPVSQVFNWHRLRLRWLFALFTTLGLFLLVLAGDQAVHRQLDPVAFGHRLYDVSSIWFERNILLERTLWPRRAYLELVDFPETGELRIGRDSPSPRLKVRALKWVYADRAAPDGWRALTWADLSPQLLGGKPVPTLPTTLLAAPGAIEILAEDPYWTLDRVEAQVGSPEVQKRLLASGMPEQNYAALRDVMEDLDRAAADSRNSRRLRKLDIPSDVVVHYWGKKTRNEMPLTRQQENNEYAGVLTDLKESVKFYVTGADYFTYPDRLITLVPPPMLTQLLRDEYVPAYIYHRPPSDGTADLLKGQRQERLAVPTSLTGGTSRVEIPSGGDLVFHGEVDKELAEVRIRFRTAAQKADKLDAGRVEIVPVHDDKKSFEKRFDNITRPIEFDFEFTDADNVKSIRHIVVQPTDDRTPDVDVTVEVIRKTPQGYMCTPEAIIPFSGRVRDDVGLAKVEYTLSYTKVETAQQVGIRAAIAAGVLGATPVSPLPFEAFGAVPLINTVSQFSESREGVQAVPPLPLLTFKERSDEKDRDFRLGKAELAERLRKEPPKDAQIKDFDVKPNLEFLDLRERLEALSKSQSETIRPRYKLRLTVTATDNNVETGPRAGQNKETFTFLVVPYEELLGEMAKDEEAVGGKMTELVGKMDEVRAGIQKVLERMPAEAGNDEFRSVASRMVELEEAVIKGKDTCQEIFSDYTRLLNEVKTNRLPEQTIKSKEQIHGRLDEALRGLFPRAEEAHAAFRKALEERHAPDPPQIQESRQRQEELFQHLKYTLDLMGQLDLLNKLQIKLADVAEKQARLLIMTRDVKQDEEDLLLDKLGQLEPKAEPVEVNRGEKRIVSVDLGRGVKQDRADQLIGRLRVKLSCATEGAVLLPAVAHVPRLAESLQFEITGGDKVGDYVIQILPTNIRDVPVDMKDIKGPLLLKVKVK